MNDARGGKGDAPGVVRVRAGGGSADYDVVVEAGLLERLPELLAERAPAHAYAVVSDSNVAELHGRRVTDALTRSGARADLHIFPAGERHKTRATWGGLTDDLLAAGHGRDSVVVAVGGGVTGDLAGFVAATFMRGVPVVQVPTSTVAMVDAAVGGKTGVDAPAGKNLVGAFHPPRVVAVDPRTVATLPRARRAEGWAEAVKHGAILDGAYLERLEHEAEALLEGRPEAVERAVRRSVELKADVVGRDEREGGLRQILNFGHTFGHAFEAASGYALSHGDAVALGMVLEARLGESIGVTRDGTARRVAAAVTRLELPSGPPGPLVARGGMDVEALLAYTRVDKKGRGGRPRWVLLREPGMVARRDGVWSHEIDDAAVESVLREALADA